jgi:hypothetical protein
MKSAAIGLFVVGSVLFLIALIKFTVIGYYPEDVTPFGILGAAGTLGLWVAAKLWKMAENA